MSAKKPSALFAAFLSLLLPGLGQYNLGLPLRALGYFLLYAVLLLVSATFFWTTFSGLLASFGLFLVLYLVSIVDAVLCARNNELGPRSWVYRWYSCFVLLILISAALEIPKYFIQQYYIEAFKIPNSSMEAAIQVGDHLMVDKSYYRSHAPARGDISIFTLPDAPNVVLIKRIVALPGESVEVRGRELRINGEVIEESYATYLSGGIRDFGPETVPEGKVFLLGDKRDASRDSRYWTDPFLPIERLLGRAEYLYWTHEKDFSRLGKIR